MNLKYTPVHSGRLYEQIVEQIENRIISGEIKEGDRLPTETELALQFKVSRTAVREAMKALSLRGLIEVQPGRGTFVTANSQLAIRNSLNLLIKLESEEGISAVVGVREILEPEIAALAASLANEEQIKLMREAVVSMDDALEDPDVFVESDLNFHRALAEGTQNPIIPILIDSIVDILREQRKRTSLSEGGLERGQYYHKRILQAVEEHNPLAAREAMREHLNQVVKDSEGSNQSINGIMKGT